jgi:hypothetical protein
LIGCEFSGVVRRAFAARGHFAVSCDLLPGEGLCGRQGDYDSIRAYGYHYQGDVLDLVLGDANLYMEHGGFDLAIFHPPCTRLANSGVRWLHERNLWSELDAAAAFFRALLALPIDRIAVENPIPHRHALERIGRKYDQIIQPWKFGHGETKATCLWLKNLPPLTPTRTVAGRTARVHRESPGADRWKRRSITYQGFADAMADQWGGLGGHNGDRVP